MIIDLYPYNMAKREHITIWINVSMEASYCFLVLLKIFPGVTITVTIQGAASWLDASDWILVRIQIIGDLSTNSACKLPFECIWNRNRFYFTWTCKDQQAIPIRMTTCLLGSYAVCYRYTSAQAQGFLHMGAWPLTHGWAPHNWVTRIPEFHDCTR